VAFCRYLRSRRGHQKESCRTEPSRRLPEVEGIRGSSECAVVIAVVIAVCETEGW